MYNGENDMNEEHIFIVRCGEVALKGMNKPYFERMLAERIRKLLKKFDGVSVYRHEGLIFVRADKSLDKQAVIREISKVFGVASISPAVECESNMEAIGAAAVEYMLEAIRERGVKTFKVEAKRADKNFPVKSPEIGRRIGAAVLKGCKVLKVDVHDPDCRLFVDVRHDKTYIYQDKIPGFGGLPLGTNGKGMSLLSGGIDSPVATWMMAKRGMLIEAVHFHSYPYTSERDREKVEELASLVATLRPVPDARDQSAADPGADRPELPGGRDHDPGAPVHDADRRTPGKRDRVRHADHR